ncbi:MAG: DUF5687 family protein [Candidatus Helarchaeota archaeon]
MFKNNCLIKQLLKYEYKAIIRSKYLKYSLLHSYIFIPLGLFIITNNEIKNEALDILWTCLLLAIPVMGISAYTFSKDGFYYPGLMTRNIPLKIYVLSKIVFIILYSILFYICILPFIYKCTPLIVCSFVAGSFYYIGFGTLVTLYFSSFDNHKISLNRSPFFNYEGFSVIKVILTFPVVSPLFFWDKTRYVGIGIMFLLGIFGFIFYNSIINLLVKNLKNRKYFLLNLPDTIHK